MDKEKLVPVNNVDGIQINADLLQKSILNIDEEKNVTIDSYLFEQLGIDETEIKEEKKELFKKNFMHLMCQVLNDFNVIGQRIKKYRVERANLDGVKSNEAEFRRRKLEYFAKLNKRAIEDIIVFLNDNIVEYLLTADCDMLQRAVNNENWGDMYINRRYKYAQVSEYYDADFDYSVVVKAPYLPGVSFVNAPKTEKEFLEMRKKDPTMYYAKIEKLIEQNDLVEYLKNTIEGNYHLHRRKEIFSDLVALYRDAHYQSFIALGLLQLEGIFFDICSMRFGNKENAGALEEKAQKVLGGRNEISFMRYYPYFAYDVPLKRNEIAHTGFIQTDNIKQLADEVLLDLNAVVQMAIMESDVKFRFFMMINEAISELDFTDKKAVNKKLICELVAVDNMAPDVFWDILKNPNQFKEEIDFYKMDDLPGGHLDVPSVVNKISDLVYQCEFWEEMVEIVNSAEKDKSTNEDLNQFFVKMAKNYVAVLNENSKNKCIEILKLLK